MPTQEKEAPEKAEQERKGIALLCERVSTKKDGNIVRDDWIMDTGPLEILKAYPLRPITIVVFEETKTYAEDGSVKDHARNVMRLEGWFINADQTNLSIVVKKGEIIDITGERKTVKPADFLEIPFCKHEFDPKKSENRTQITQITPKGLVSFFPILKK